MYTCINSKQKNDKKEEKKWHRNDILLSSQFNDDKIMA